MRAKRRIQMVHQRNVVSVVEAAAGRQQPGLIENSFGVLVAFLRQQYLVRFLIDPIVALPRSSSCRVSLGASSFSR